MVKIEDCKKMHNIVLDMLIDARDEQRVAMCCKVLKTTFNQLLEAKQRQLTEVEERKKPFNVTITETLSRIINVRANSEEEARKLILDKWYAQTFVLDSEDFVNVDVTVQPTDDDEHKD